MGHISSQNGSYTCLPINILDSLEKESQKHQWFVSKPGKQPVESISFAPFCFLRIQCKPKSEFIILGGGIHHLELCIGPSLSQASLRAHFNFRKDGNMSTSTFAHLLLH